MSRRDQIQMTPEEINAYLAEQTILNIATMGPNGRPHLAPLWFFPKDGNLVGWTYGKSQKVANLRRLAEATVLVESGEAYEELRGISMECDVQLLEDIDTLTDIGLKLMHRYSGGTAGTTDNASTGEPDEAIVNAIAQQATKRVGLVFTPTKTVSWNHAKLGGAY